jgi:hypothetical protein
MSDIFVMGFLLTETIAFLLFKAKTCRCCRNRALRGNHAPATNRWRSPCCIPTGVLNLFSMRLNFA